ncbi:hypothetical protein SAMN06265365_13537 [Tistlia consotensis]|uniref:Tat (Twin-arginine translocation) pathway signal sequence n=1 Tax=Tistlia consotensis USBA 355 TaxID=560819 RepID=A0A1Y6CWC6_9PROT|nr:hypothetical protein [Tistlia consotensis]SMF79521.1 hypothetical protein SAMN05428998_14014 [Tistlia consotensis USBA 355]SNS17105.1 hypothetical protein SAMN06265365_13537 [Tistlia consotensis]
MTSDPSKTDPAVDSTVEARRRFLASCGRFAAATPPAMALLLADAGRSPVFAQSGGYGGGDGHSGEEHGDNGFGNGGFDGTPGHSGFSHSGNAHEKRDDRIR